MNGISYKDAGEYRCKAKNLAGISEASITVIVVGVVTTTLKPQRFGRRLEADLVTKIQTKEMEDKVTISTIWSPETLTPTLSLTDTTVEPTIAPTTVTSTTVKVLERKPQKTKGQSQAANKKSQIANSNNKERDLLKNVSDVTESNSVVRNLKVTRETKERVTLTWKTPNTTDSSSLTVLYSKYGEREMLRLSTDPSKNKVTIDGLQPGTKYMACVCPKVVQPKKDQCIVFSTDSFLLNEEENSFQMTILIVASSIACIFVLPIIFLLLYKVMKLQRKPQSPNAEDLLKETYVKFETLSLRPRSINNGGELWTRRDTTESERLLLCSRSSMDSQGTFRSEGSRPEYYC